MIDRKLVETNLKEFIIHLQMGILSMGDKMKEISPVLMKAYYVIKSKKVQGKQEEIRNADTGNYEAKNSFG